MNQRIKKYQNQVFNILTQCKQGTIRNQRIAVRMTRLCKQYSDINQAQMEKSFYHILLCQPFHCQCQKFIVSQEKTKLRSLQRKRTQQVFIKLHEKNQYRRQFNNLLKSKLRFKKNINEGQVNLLNSIRYILEVLRMKLKTKNYMHISQLWKQSYYKEIIRSAGMEDGQIEYRKLIKKSSSNIKKMEPLSQNVSPSNCVRKLNSLLKYDKFKYLN